MYRKDSAGSQYPFTQNRELSWLRFNKRVLEEAEDETVPLFERLRFIAIFTNNLDEFFMIRVGSLFDLSGINREHIDSKSGMTPTEQLGKIYEAVRPLYAKRDDLFSEVEHQLRMQGIFSLSYKELGPQEKELVDTYFRDVISPILSPQIVDAHHPFPHLQNKMQHVGTLLKAKEDTIFGIVSLPDSIPEIIFLPGDNLRYIAVEKILLHHAEDVFNMYEVTEKTCFCVTRNADVNWDDEAFDIDFDFRSKMKKLLRKRKRLAVVRLEASNDITPAFKSYLCRRFNIEKEQIFVFKAPIKMEYVKTLAARLSAVSKKELTYPAFYPVIPEAIVRQDSILRQVQKKDILLFHPYESMEPFVKMIKEAAYDPSVLSIKITIYRLARKAKLVEYLCAAAENGKDVTVLIELRARFDEQNNIDWSERLEEAGCKLLYGFEEVKVHSKVCLVTLREKGKVKYITHIGTGNYNENTADAYTDLSLLTADQQIGNDAAEFFKNIAIGNLTGEYKSFLVAPTGLKSDLFRLIDGQIQKGPAGRIIMKLNSITDTEIIEKLSEASCSGVDIKLIVRGICCILPGIPGKTDNVKITSIVGRFLEHARIYSFGSGEEQNLYISSADMMTRNMERRIEVACPIMDPELRERINRILEIMEYDNVKARILSSDGDYLKKTEKRLQIDSQELLIQNAVRQQNRYVAGNKTFRGFLRNLRQRRTASGR